MSKDREKTSPQSTYYFVTVGRDVQTEKDHERAGAHRYTIVIVDFRPGAIHRRPNIRGWQ